MFMLSSTGGKFSQLGSKVYPGSVQFRGARNRLTLRSLLVSNILYRRVIMENTTMNAKVNVEEKKERETGRKPLPILHTKDVNKLARYMMLNGVR